MVPSFGISDAWSFDESRATDELDRLASSGATMVRLPLGWPPSDIAALERRVDALRSRGIGILGLVGSLGSQRAIPTASEAADATGSLVDRLKDRIHHWEFWHQPDDAAFWPADDLVS